MKLLLAKYPSYLFLLPVFFVLHKHGQLPFFIPANKTILKPLVYYLIGGILIFSLFFYFLKALHKAGIITFFILLFLLFFGDFHQAVKNLVGINFFSSYTMIVPGTVAVFFAIGFYLLKKEQAVGRFVQYLNVLFAALIMYEIGMLAIYGYRYSHDHNLSVTDFSLSNNCQKSTIPDSQKPDIYFLVFDEYTNNNTLQKIWHFDNSAINNWLKSEGFFVANNSKSNYDFTPFSVSATLHMQYNNRLGSTDGTKALNMLKAVNSLSNNNTFRILTKENYQLVFLAPFQNTITPYAGIKEFDEFPFKKIYDGTFFYRLQEDVLWKYPVIRKKILPITSDGKGVLNYANQNQKRIDILDNIEQIKKAARKKMNVPRFVYGHIMITHRPHLFDSTGGSRKENVISTRQGLFESYIEQVQFANKTIKELVSYIKSNSQRKCIILIQGDHGFRYLPLEQQQYYFPVFNCFYFPNKEYQLLYDSVSSVNTFRIVMNSYFNQHFPLLKDSSYKVKYQLSR